MTDEYEVPTHCLDEIKPLVPEREYLEARRRIKWAIQAAEAEVARLRTVTDEMAIEACCVWFGHRIWLKSMSSDYVKSSISKMRAALEAALGRR